MVHNYLVASIITNKGYLYQENKKTFPLQICKNIHERVY